MPKGRGRWAPSDTHWTNSPSRQPSAIIQSAVEVAPSIRITVMTQHVNAITWDTKNAFISQAGIKIYAQKYKHEKFFFRKICTERNILKLFDDFSNFIERIMSFLIYLSIHLSIYLSIYISIYLSVYLSIYLSIHLSNHLPGLHKVIFTNRQSTMRKLFSFGHNLFFISDDKP